LLVISTRSSRSWPVPIANTTSGQARVRASAASRSSTGSVIQAVRSGASSSSARRGAQPVAQRPVGQPERRDV
jgi:hypothetical protein